LRKNLTYTAAKAVRHVEEKADATVHYNGKAITGTCKK
jgi:hypothetical protein